MLLWVAVHVDVVLEGIGCTSAPILLPALQGRKPPQVVVL
jgi:hypothetical protein